MDKRKHLEVSSLGGKSKREDTSRKGTVQTQDDTRVSVPKLEDVLNILEEAQDVI